MTSKEIADELQAEEFLLARGFTKEKCERCGGKGVKQGPSGRLWTCMLCDGRGWNWIAPIKK